MTRGEIIIALNNGHFIESYLDGTVRLRKSMSIEEGTEISVNIFERLKRFNGVVHLGKTNELYGVRHFWGFKL